MKAKIFNYSFLFMALIFISGCGGDDDNPVDAAEGGTVKYSGKTYHTVVIGTQTWLKENLDVGTMIQTNQEQTNNGTIEKYCYNNNLANCTTYGGLYQWNEAMAYTNTPGTKGLCPDGFHIPTIAEFQALKAAVSDDGNALKAIGQGTGNGVGTNTSGFSALLGGIRYNDGNTYYMGENAFFWSSEEFSPGGIETGKLWGVTRDVHLDVVLFEYAVSIRCIKN